ncbi:Nicotianamine synthase protein-domain-containing protein [Xylariales sp. AK1849]|nr:Nicotianamine synthase protein-domain-containing protein [Xylariales sp. AK1849]
MSRLFGSIWGSYTGSVKDEPLTSLVTLCCQIHDAGTIEAVLSDSKVCKILPSFLKGHLLNEECCLEAHWANHVRSARDPEEALQRLEKSPYHGNYVDLARLEFFSLCSSETLPSERIAFLGSGLPLTSLCLLQALKVGTGPNTNQPIFAKKGITP